MSVSLSATLLALVGAVAAYPVETGLFSRSCEPGTLVCNGSNQFAICNFASKLEWMNVSAGTRCACSGTICTIETGAAAEAPPIKFTAPEPASVAASSAPASSAPASSAPASSAPASSAPAHSHAPSHTLHTSLPASSSASSPAPTSSHPSSPASSHTSHISSPASPPASSHPSSVTSSHPSSATSSPAPASSTVQPKAPQPTGESKPDNKVEKPHVAGKSYVQTFSGNGEPSQGWPDESKWVDFESMWTANLANTIRNSCAANFNAENNSEQEIAAIKKAIETVSKSSGVDKRFILAVIMQESSGCVRVPTTSYGVTNPGLMQSHNGAHSCANKTPCPDDQILGMVKDGTMGTSSGDGLQQLLAGAGDGVSRYYKAARKYNSGSIAATGALQDGIATHCYASDIANRLVGWSAGVGTCSYN
ncbi:hypothetical protein E4U54_003724 [Claviceps lovelessii]|nr:hypothetical protein E4U54_003724 [Claviceps lovelessii]